VLLDVKACSGHICILMQPIDSRVSHSMFFSIVGWQKGSARILARRTRLVRGQCETTWTDIPKWMTRKDKDYELREGTFLWVLSIYAHSLKPKRSLSSLRGLTVVT
jgi:hypothetical protein